MSALILPNLWTPPKRLVRPSFNFIRNLMAKTAFPLEMIGHGGAPPASIAFDTVNGGASVNPGTSVSWTHTMGTGAHGLLLVAVFSTSGGSDDVTGATYDGVAMSLLGSRVQVPGDRWMSLWGLLAPATGANTVVVSASSSGVIAGSSISYTGVEQSGLPDASTTNTASATQSISTALTPAANNCWIVNYSKGGTSGTDSVIGPTVIRVSSQGGFFLSDTNGPVSGGSPITTGWANTGANGNWASIVISIAPG